MIFSESVVEDLQDAILELERAKTKLRREKQVSDMIGQGLQIVSKSNDIKPLTKKVISYLQKHIPFEEALLLTLKENKSGYNSDELESQFSLSSREYSFSKKILEKWLGGYKSIYIFDASEEPFTGTPIKGGSILLQTLQIDGRKFYFLLHNKIRGRFSRDHFFQFEKYYPVIKQSISTNLNLKMRKVAESANQLKNIFLSNMSHELRTPLVSIRGFAELLEEDDLSSEERKKFVEIIHHSSDQLLNVIDDLLNLSKIEANQIRVEEAEFNLHLALRNLKNLIMVTSEKKGLAVEVSWANDVPEKIISDQIRIHQILTNLMGNAVKYTDKGIIRLEVKISDGFLNFIITDTGQGIPEDEKEKVFERFFRSGRASEKGTGLGLCISKEMANLLGGEIFLNWSEVGKGSQFIFRLPDRVLGTSVAARIESPELKMDKKQILVVDDDEVSSFLTTRSLRRFDCNIDVAAGGRDALKKAEEKKYDLILMDLRMPEMDGYEATRRLRTGGYEGPIAALTAHVRIEPKAEFERLGFNDYLMKPLDASKIENFLH